MSNVSGALFVDNDELVKRRTASKKQIVAKPENKDKDKGAGCVGGGITNPLGANNTQNINIPKSNLQQQSRAPSATLDLMKVTKTRSTCLKKRMEIYEKKLQSGFNLSRPFKDLDRLHPKNFNRLKREISTMVTRANKVYGLKIQCPKDLDFSDNKIKEEILNIKAQFVSKTEKPTLHESSRRQPSDPFDQSVPAELMREVTHHERQSRTSGDIRKI